MDPTRFDDLTKSLAAISRRRLLRGLTGAFGGALGLGQTAAAAGCQHRGETCTADGDCCGTLACGSGICQTPSGNGGAGTQGCPAGQIRCGGACVTVATDPGNCGACGVVCPADQPVCDGGACVCTATSCGAGQICCDGVCVNGSCCGDADCGACETCDGSHTCVRDTTHDGESCGAGGICVEGACCATACESDAGLTCCAGGTTCTGAGICCASGISCGGVCCDQGTACCGGTCISLTTPNNCGGCGTVCAADQVCHGGTCQTGCIIDGTFYNAGDHKFWSYGCQICQPATSTTSWTKAPAGASCSLGTRGVCCADGECCDPLYCTCCNGQACNTPASCGGNGVCN